MGHRRQRRNGRGCPGEGGGVPKFVSFQKQRRYNYRHFNHEHLPTWAEGDALLAERLDSLVSLTRALQADDGDCEHVLQAVSEAFA